MVNKIIFFAPLQFCMAKSTKSAEAQKPLGRARVPSAKAKAARENPPNETQTSKKPARKGVSARRSKIKTEIVRSGDEGDRERQSDEDVEIEEGDKVECAPFLLRYFQAAC